MKEFEMGATYEFKSGKDSIIIKFMDDSHELYYRTEIVGGSMVAEDEVGTIKQLVKRSRVLNEWTSKRIYTREEQFTLDNYGKNIRLNYKDPQLLDLYIDMALATKDFKWLKQLSKAKREVSA